MEKDNKGFGQSRMLRITRACNQHCLFCCIDFRNPEEPFFDTPLKILRAFKDLPYDGKLVEISGGEPTLSPLLPLALKLAQKNYSRTIVQTNAMKFDDLAFARNMRKVGLDAVFVSLHAPTAAVSDEITGCQGGFERTCRGIRNLQSLQIEVMLSFVICSKNYQLLPEYMDFVSTTFGNNVRIAISFVNTDTGRVELPLVPKISCVIPFLQKGLDSCREHALPCIISDFCGLPLCFLRGYETHSDMYNYLNTETGGIEHTKTEKCAPCVWEPRCRGVFSRYIKEYGDDEIVPVLEIPKGL